MNNKDIAKREALIEKWRTHIDEDWGVGDLTGRICHDLLTGSSYLWERMSLDTFLHLTTLDIALKDLLPAIMYLSGERVPLLEVSYELSFGQQWHPLERDVVAAAYKACFLVHPETGQHIHGWKEYTHMFFAVIRD